MHEHKSTKDLFANERKSRQSKNTSWNQQSGGTVLHCITLQYFILWTPANHWKKFKGNLNYSILREKRFFHFNVLPPRQHNSGWSWAFILIIEMDFPLFYFYFYQNWIEIPELHYYRSLLSPRMKNRNGFCPPTATVPLNCPLDGRAVSDFISRWLDHGWFKIPMEKRWSCSDHERSPPPKVYPGEICEWLLQH